MSLRDFNAPGTDDPISLHHEPSGNGTGLSSFHTVNPEDREPNNMPKIAGAVVVALMVGAGAVGLYAYSGSSHSTKAVVADNSLPQTPPVAPPQQTAMADNSMTPPAPPSAPSASPAPMTPAPVATTDTPKPTPVRTASSRSARSHITSSRSEEGSAAMSAQTSAPQQATPLPAAPQPSPSDVASNNSNFSAAVPNNAVTSEAPQSSAAPQQLQSSTPQASNSAPAQDQQTGATPAPAQ